MAAVLGTANDFREGLANKDVSARNGKAARKKQNSYDAARGERRTQTPDEIAIKKLVALLEKSGMPRASINNYASIIKQGEQLRFMNMPVLAEVLLYLSSINDDLGTDNFNIDIISPYMDRVLPKREPGLGGKDISPEEMQIMRIRMAATFFRYAQYYLNTKAVAISDQTPVTIAGPADLEG
jgi:hypothetical protein